MQTYKLIGRQADHPKHLRVRRCENAQSIKDESNDSIDKKPAGEFRRLCPGGAPQTAASRVPARDQDSRHVSLVSLALALTGWAVGLRASYELALSGFVAAVLPGKAAKAESCP